MLQEASQPAISLDEDRIEENARSVELDDTVASPADDCGDNVVGDVRDDHDSHPASDGASHTSEPARGQIDEEQPLESSHEPPLESVREPALESSREPVLEPLREPALESSHEPVLEPWREPALESSHELALESVREPPNEEAQTADTDAEQLVMNTTENNIGDDVAPHTPDTYPSVATTPMQPVKSTQHCYQLVPLADATVEAATHAAHMLVATHNAPSVEVCDSLAAMLADIDVDAITGVFDSMRPISSEPHMALDRTRNVT